MALPKALCDREQAKFKEDSNGDTCVNVCGDLETLPKGATGPVLITGTTVTDTSAAYPSVNQVGRGALSIRNIDPAESIWIVNSVGITKAAAALDIWEIGPNESFNSDFDDTNKINLVADSGKTVSIQILEIKI